MQIVLLVRCGNAVDATGVEATTPPYASQIATRNDTGINCSISVLIPSLLESPDSVVGFSFKKYGVILPRPVPGITLYGLEETHDLYLQRITRLH